MKGDHSNHHRAAIAAKRRQIRSSSFVTAVAVTHEGQHTLRMQPNSCITATRRRRQCAHGGAPATPPAAPKEAATEPLPAASPRRARDGVAVAIAAVAWLAIGDCSKLLA